jgi:putative oxidoreductase
MTIAFVIGRAIVGVYFLMNAYNHIFKSSHMVAYAAGKKVPSPKAAIIGSGLLLLVGGLSILLWVYPVIGILCLIVFLIPVTIMMHNFWKETDPMARMSSKIEFLKNLALIGLLLIILSTL